MASSISTVAILFAITLFLTLKVSTATMEGNENGTQLHFYMQEITEPPNATVIKVLSSPLDQDHNHTNSFGAMFVFDHAITAGQDLTSRPLGRMQGTTTIASLDGSVGLFTISLKFTDVHPLTGSSLIIIGTVLIENEIKELTVVGGTGRLQFAQGYTIVRRLPSYSLKSCAYEMTVTLFNI